MYDTASGQTLCGVFNIFTIIFKLIYLVMIAFTILIFYERLDMTAFSLPAYCLLVNTADKLALLILERIAFFIKWQFYIH